MREHRSVRKYKKDKIADDVIERLVGTAQCAAFAGQMYSVVYETEGKLPLGAPLLFTICVDLHKFSKIMDKRDWEWITNDLYSFILGIQDASYFAQNLVLAAESMGFGTCFLGYTPYYAAALNKKMKLPQKVFPFVQLTVGVPDEIFPTRPRYPLNFTLFKNEYEELNEELVEEAMEVMDKGYLAQEYYKRLDAMIDLTGERKETFNFDNYSWTEHISRKWGQFHPETDKISKQLKKCGFNFQNGESANE